MEDRPRGNDVTKAHGSLPHLALDIRAGMI
jgi:hypothetical protein